VATVPCGWSECSNEVPAPAGPEPCLQVEREDFCSDECGRRFLALLDSGSAAYRQKAAGGRLLVILGRASLASA
jgi:hypothetical protein